VCAGDPDRHARGRTRALVDTYVLNAEAIWNRAVSWSAPSSTRIIARPRPWAWSSSRSGRSCRADGSRPWIAHPQRVRVDELALAAIIMTAPVFLLLDLLLEALVSAQSRGDMPPLRRRAASGLPRRGRRGRRRRCAPATMAPTGDERRSATPRHERWSSSRSSAFLLLVTLQHATGCPASKPSRLQRLTVEDPVASSVT